MKNINRQFWLMLLLVGGLGQLAWTFVLDASSFEMIFALFVCALVGTGTTWVTGAILDRTKQCEMMLYGGLVLEGFVLLCSSILLKSHYGFLLTLILLVFAGAMSYEACFHTWLTEHEDPKTRGKIAAVYAIIPFLSEMIIYSLLVKLFGGILNFTIVLGIVMVIVGGVGFRSTKKTSIETPSESIFDTMMYCFKKESFEEHKMFYLTLFAFSLFMTSILIFMPYLVIYVVAFITSGNALFFIVSTFILAGLCTLLVTHIYDLQGFQLAIKVAVGILLAGYVMMILFTNVPCAFIGTWLMMTGCMSTFAVFSAEIRCRTPQNRIGQFQGLRYFFQIFVPSLMSIVISTIVLGFNFARGIFVGALLMAGLTVYMLSYIFKVIRTQHYDLESEDTKEFLSSNKLAWQEHPRPQMQRPDYLSLNGIWQLDGQDILVPFPPQSSMSNYKGDIKDCMTYQKNFRIPDSFTKSRILLHFGAVDQVYDVVVNGHVVGHHEGGYLPFTFDITDVVSREEENRIEVHVTDTLSIEYPYGKQTKKRGGMWYTPVSGIWQTVWLENVCDKYIQEIKITPDLNGVHIQVYPEVPFFEVEVQLSDDKCQRFTLNAQQDYLKIDQPIHWTCDNPYLYHMKVFAGEDEISSYFALRTIGFETIQGVKRVVLNGKPIFMHGLLDQGYYCDGLFLPTTEKEFERDILRMKELGFNLLRKHIKVEPEYFYYACDKLGMLVMQDFVNNGKYQFVRDTIIPTYIVKKKDDTKTPLDTKIHQRFIEHSEALVHHLYNHPCIIAYTIFNEGWGQFHSDYVYDLVKTWDDTRLIDSTSGWWWQKKNEFDSDHIYFKQIDIEVKDRPYFVSECGGFTMLVKGHIYSKYNVYGYGVCKDARALTDKIISMYREMILPAIPNGLCGCIYTQVSDVEDEINGLYTYDRQVCKVIKEDMQLLSKDISQIMENIK